MKIKIHNSNIQKLVSGSVPEFPKYTTQIINLANSNSQGTRPKQVGQMSDLIQEFKGNSLNDWRRWYLNKQPQALDNAFSKIFPMIESFKKAIVEIDEDMVKQWIEDLIILKTFR